MLDEIKKNYNSYKNALVGMLGEIKKNYNSHKNALVWMRYKQKEIPPTGVY